MRDHRKLQVFVSAERLALQVHEAANALPRDETFLLAHQLRSSAVSIASNIAEGCARRSRKEYVYFLTVAYGSARELEYQLSLARHLGYPIPPELENSAGEICQALRTLIQSQVS